MVLPSTSETVTPPLQMGAASAAAAKVLQSSRQVGPMGLHILTPSSSEGGLSSTSKGSVSAWLLGKVKLTPQRSAKLGVKFGRKAVPDLDTLLGTMKSLPAVEFTKYIKEDTALEEYDEDSGAGSLMHAETLKMYRTGGICVLEPQQACQAQNVLNSSGSRGTGHNSSIGLTITMLLNARPSGPLLVPWIASFTNADLLNWTEYTDWSVEATTGLLDDMIVLCDKKQYTPEQYTGQDRVDGVALLKTKIMRVYNKRGYEASQKIKQEAIDPPVKATTGPKPVPAVIKPLPSKRSSVATAAAMQNIQISLRKQSAGEKRKAEKEAEQSEIAAQAARPGLTAEEIAALAEQSILDAQDAADLVAAGAKQPSKGANTLLKNGKTSNPKVKRK